MSDVRAPFSPLVRVFAARAGRVALGVTLLLGALVLVAGVLCEWQRAALLLLLTWPTALAVAVVARQAALLGGERLARRHRALGGGPTVPVSALSSPREASRLHALAGGLERPSYTLPLAGVALTAPLTLHAPLFLLAPQALPRLFDWIALSAILAGPAHLVLAMLSYDFGCQLYAGTLKRSAERQALRALVITVFASLFPGALAMGIPPVIVAFTGLLFVPITFVVVERRRVMERALLGGEHQRAEAVQVVEVAGQR